MPFDFEEKQKGKRRMKSIKLIVAYPQPKDVSAFGKIY